jgi:hypothetical protein
LPIQSAVTKLKKLDLIQGGGKIKRQQDINHLAPKHTPIIYHLCNLPHFSLVPTLKEFGQVTTMQQKIVNIQYNY